MAPNTRTTSRATSRKKYQDRNKDNIEKNIQRNYDSAKDMSVSRAAHILPAANYVQASSMPDPIPTDTVSIGTIARTTLTITPTFSVPSQASISRTNEVSISSGKFLDSPSTTTVWIPASKPTSRLESPAASRSADPYPPSSARLPVYGVILLALGGVTLALFALLVLRCCLCRNGRVDRPRPSAPILQDSPLFGGKDRYSRGIWSDPSFNNLLTSHAKAERGDGWRPLSGDNEPISGKTQKMRQSVFLMPHPATNNPTTSQLSPTSVYTTAMSSTAVGVALEFPMPPPPATQPLKVKGKGTEVKATKATRRRSVATSLYDGTDIGSPMLTEAEVSVAYQAPRPAPSPGKTKGSLKSSGSSRDNVRRPAHKKNPSRASQGSLHRSMSTSRPTRESEREEPIPHVLPTVKSQERRDRDTKALTSALGLASPPPPSSCFSPVSIYPDDSLSIAHRRDYLRPQSEMPPSEMPSPTGTHAALGDLMLQDFPSMATFNSMQASDPFVGEPEKKSWKGKVTDRPPRVPSPPPLPSLSQMALENADPDYHSPTYSIYGLYEAQRKSKRSSFIS